MKFLIFIIISMIILSIIVNKFILKENLDLKSYANIYVNSVEKASKGLTENAVRQCNQSSDNYKILQTSINNYIKIIDVSNLNNTQNTINTQINSVNNIVNTPITNYKLGETSYYNPDLSLYIKLIGGLPIGVLNNINISLTNSSSTNIVNPIIQFIIKNYDNIQWISKLVSLDNIKSANFTITQGDSNASVSSYSIFLPIVIPDNTSLSILLSKNVYITNVVINANYQTTENTTLTLYDMQRYINTSATYQTSLINHFNYIKAITGSTFNLVEIRNSKISSDDSLLIKTLNYLISTQNILLNQSIIYYNNTNSKLNQFIFNINNINTNFINFNNNLTNADKNKQDLLNYISQINTQITTLSSYITSAQNAVKNTTSYTDTTSIKNALGSIYTSAQTDVDNALSSKNKAQSDLDSAIKTNASTAIIQDFRNKLISATEIYIQSYENLRFLLDPNNLTYDKSNTSEISNVNINLNKIKLLNIFLKYFKDNNIDIQNTFLKLLNNTDTVINNTSNLDNNIINIFRNAINNIITNRNVIAINALSICNTTNTNLSNLLGEVQKNLDTLNNVINNSNINKININTFLTNINNKIGEYKNILESINTQNLSASLYKIEIITKYQTYSTTEDKEYLLGTIQNTGRLVKLYYFANVYSWQTCIASSTQFIFMIKSSSGINKYIKKYNLNTSPYITFEFFQNVDIQVVTGDRVMVGITTSFIFCKVEASDILSKLDIIIPSTPLKRL
jgi:hypothetical protein